jgi:anti-anti-sigma regulatory factor
MSDQSLKASDVVALAANLDLSAAQALKESLTDAMLAGSDVVVSGASVERVGTPAVQVLLAAARTLASEGRRFSLLESSEALDAAFEELGLAATFEEWSAR